MTYAERLAFETANEVFELDLICKRIDEFESRSVESTIQAAIIKAMQAQREACARAFLLYKYSPSGRVERVAYSLNDLAIAHEEGEIAQEILKAEVQP